MSQISIVFLIVVVIVCLACYGVQQKKKKLDFPR
jgi:hypothetical protein